VSLCGLTAFGASDRNDRGHSSHCRTRSGELWAAAAEKEFDQAVKAATGPSSSDVSLSGSTPWARPASGGHEGMVKPAAGSAQLWYDSDRDVDFLDIESLLEQRKRGKQLDNESIAAVAASVRPAADRPRHTSETARASIGKVLSPRPEHCYYSDRVLGCDASREEQSELENTDTSDE
jgi:hypothetical protein